MVGTFAADRVAHRFSVPQQIAMCHHALRLFQRQQRQLMQCYHRNHGPFQLVVNLKVLHYKEKLFQVLYYQYLPLVTGAKSCNTQELSTLRFYSAYHLAVDSEQYMCILKHQCIFLFPVCVIHDIHFNRRRHYATNFMIALIGYLGRS